MAESSSQSSDKRISLKKQAESLNYRRFKKSLQTSDKCLHIREGRYIAAFDRHFCDGAEPVELIQQVDALMKAGQILKDGDVSDVSRITWNNRDVAVKRYNHVGFIHSLRYTIKKSRALKGWLNAHYLGALQIPTPRSVAYIEQRKGLLVWQSYLVTEYVEGRKLWNFLRDDDVTEQKRLDGLRKVAELLEKLWKLRITHGDLKHTNILMTADGPVLTDLDGMVVHRWEPLYRNKRTKDMRRFLRKTDISPELYSHCRELISGGIDPCHEPADDFDRMRIEKWAIRARKDFPERDVKDLLSMSDSSSQGRNQFTAVSSSRFARVFRCGISSGGNGRMLYLKKYLCRSMLDFVKHLFRPSRAGRAFNASLMLEKHRFNAPAVVGLFERRLGPFCTDNLLLTEEVDSAGSMAQVLTEISRDPGGDASIRKRAIIKAFAETVGQMHARDIFHGDLRLGNVLVVEDQQKWRFFFLDNERTKKFYRLPSRLRLKNLVQVNMFRDGITNTDRMRFFKTYLSMNPGV
ncbi:MAG: lipopolysaccharide kinase InaA family protein, partial [Planctomycetota bacterium]